MTSMGEMLSSRIRTKEFSVVSLIVARLAFITSLTCKIHK